MNYHPPLTPPVKGGECKFDEELSPSNLAPMPVHTRGGSSTRGRCNSFPPLAGGIEGGG